MKMIRHILFVAAGAALAWLIFQQTGLGLPLTANDELMKRYSKESHDMKMRTLTPDEERVIVHKGTERPFSGSYHNTKEPGIYTCRRCGAMLYRSSDKFDSGCGWPSFDDEIPFAVKRQPDADGMRLEITCAHCGAHLGHVFEGERMTPKNTRHCVNSISLLLVPEKDVVFGEAIVAGGCFWGVEYWFEKLPGVLSTESGYTGGATDHPTYEQVCSGETGHAEAIRVLYDPVRLDYETILRLFFEIHDPTQLNRQGPDVGDQYRSAVFYKDDSQREIATRLIALLQKRGYDVKTELEPAGTFWKAENYHQDYYRRKGSLPYCHAPEKRFGKESSHD